MLLYKVVNLVPVFATEYTCAFTESPMTLLKILSKLNFVF